MINKTLLDPLYGEFEYDFYEEDETYFVHEPKQSFFKKYFWWLYCCC